MSSQVFYRKWRPQALAEVLGQEHVTRTLLNALAAERVAHAYLFCGPRGTGKTSTGRILAKAVNCQSSGRGEPCNECSVCQAISEGRALDLVEIDAASNRGIDEIRDLREKVNFAPSIARYKVYIIDEVHMLTEPAFNALLKTLEEPPPHIIFVLATTEVHKVPMTILSRCQRFDFRRLSQGAIVAKLKRICDQEGIQTEAEALMLIARSTGGSLRDAENLLEQLVTYYGSELSCRQVQEELGIIGDERVRQLVNCILSRDIAQGLAAINSVASDGLDLQQFNRELVEYLRGMLLVKAGAENVLDVPREEVAEMGRLGNGISVEEVSRAIRLFSGADFRAMPQSTLPLELALVDYASSVAKGSETAAAPPAPVKAAKRPVPAAEKKVESTAEPPAPVRAAEPAVSAAEEMESIAEPPAPVEAVEATTSGAERTVSAAESPPAGGTPELEQIQSRWNDFVNACRGEGSAGNLDALLRKSCRPMELKDDILTLGFYWEFQKGKIEDPKYRHMVERKLMDVFQAPYKVRCVLVDRGKKSKPGAASESLLVKEALKMGAEIVDKEQNE